MNTHLKIVITTIFLFAAFSAQADFVSDNTTMSYSQCSGIVSLRFPAIHADQPSVGCDLHNSLRWIEFYAVRPNNTEQYLGTVDWDNSGRNCRSTRIFPRSGRSCRGYYHCGDSGVSSDIVGSVAYITTQFANMDNSFFGNVTKVRMKGRFDYVGASGGFDFDFTLTGDVQTKIDPPSGIRAEVDQSCDGVLVSWTNPSNVASTCGASASWWVDIFRDGQYLGNAGKSGSFFDNNAVKGIDHKYKVFSRWYPNGSRLNDSGFTSESNGRRIGPLGAPDNIQASSGSCSDNILVSWDWNHTSTNLEGFRIQRKLLPNGMFQTIEDLVPAGERNYEDTVDGASPIDKNSQYEYRVLSLNNCTPPDQSDPPAASPNAIGSSPGAPIGPNLNSAIAATGAGANKITLTWIHNSGPVDKGFIIERQGGGNTAIIKLSDNDQRTYDDINAAGCVTYTYTIKTKTDCFPDGVGTSSQSARLQPDLSQAFTSDGLQASKGYFSDRVELSWTNRNQGQTSGIIISRRIAGSTDPFTDIVTGLSGTALYQDQTAEAGVLYEYKIVATARCENQDLISNSVTTTGFRSKSARVSGNVSFTGNVNVEGVRIIGESDASTTRFSTSMNGNSLRIAHNANQSLTNELFLETWLKPVSYGADFKVISKDQSYRLMHDSGTASYAFIVEGDVNQNTISIPRDSFPTNQWNHIAVQVRNDSLFIYKNGIMLASSTAGANSSIQNSTNPIIIGENLMGNLKEIRIWKKSKSDIQIIRDQSRFVSGTEVGIFVYLPINEQSGNYVYDRSKTGSNFNKNDAAFIGGVTWISNEAPDVNRLNYSAYTNSFGNYTITLPYNNAGQDYELTPAFKNHEFSPNQRQLFVGDDASVVNNVDFIDVSSFLVTGSLLYQGTACPVPDAFVSIDGQIQSQGGEPVKTNAQGEFDLQVPIGLHVLSLSKPGHDLEGARFPPSGEYDFQENENFGIFDDPTVRTIVGRVVGGEREGNKVPGLGRSTNNIGQARVFFEAQNTCMSTDTLTDIGTGEYAIDLPPLKLLTRAEILMDNDGINPNFLSNPPVDLTTELVVTSVKDSVFDATDPSIFERIDSVSFNKRVDFIHISSPKISVFDRDGISPFIGDTLLQIETPGGLITRNLRQNPMLWPIFTERTDDYLYRCMIRVFESYKNHETGIEDLVPTTKGKIIIDNQISHLNQFGDLDSSEVQKIHTINMSDVNTPDTLKSLVYSFKAASPNFAPNTNFDFLSYTKPFNITLIKSDGSSIEWAPVTDPSKIVPGSKGYFRGYILGSRSIGPNFVTEGVEVPDYILRDPPGSTSSASITEGTTKSSVSSYSWNLGSNASTSDKVKLGARFSVGIGVATDNDLKSNTQVGFDAAISGGRGGSQKVGTSWSRQISTSSAAKRVGADSDVYIGRSNNIEYGLSQELVIVDDAQCAAIKCVGPAPLAGTRFAIKDGIAIVPGGYATTFIYTEKHIEGTLIPDLLEVRDGLLGSSRYTSILPVDDPNYGKNNDAIDLPGRHNNDPFEPDSIDLRGASYTFNYGSLPIEEALARDTVRKINHQIRKWKEVIALNEWEKANVDNAEVIDSLKMQELADLDSLNKDIKTQFIALSAAAGGGAVLVAYGLIAAPAVGTSIAGYATLATTTALGITQAELTGAYEAYQQQRQRIIDKFDQIGTPNNYSIDAGTGGVSESMSTSTASSYSTSLEYTLGGTFKTEIEASVSNTGVGFTKGFGIKFKNSRSWTDSESSSESIAFTLSDNNVGDFMSVDVFQSPLGWGPIFKKQAGGKTSCPHEGVAMSKYYTENGEPVVLSKGTQQRDKPAMTVSPSIKTNIPADGTATFDLTIFNNSESFDTRSYLIETIAESNPLGANVSIDFFPTAEVRFPGGTSIQKVLTVEKGPGAVYNYDSLMVIIYAECDKLIYRDTVVVSAHFIPDCTPIEIQQPLDQWVANNSFNKVVPTVIGGYDINHAGLEKIVMEYKPSDQAIWIPLQDFWKDTTGMNDPNLLPIPTGSVVTSYNWDIDMVNDGTYDLRAKSVCTQAEEYSNIHRGIIDEVNPTPFGTPSPADGILGPDDDIIITFNEPIETGNIVKAINFDVRGVVNGTTITQQESVQFDGINDYLEIPEYQLQQRSFTFETWVLRNQLGRQTIFSQSDSSDTDQLLIAFEDDNSIIVKIGDKSFKSSTSISDNQWHHFAVIYNRTDNRIQIQIDDRPIDSQDNFFTNYRSSGKINVGKDIVGNYPYFEGLMQEMRLWNISRNIADIFAKKSITLSGREIGLIGNWPLDEAIGNIANDKVRSRHAVLKGATWSILPQSHSFEFNGTSDYLEALNTSLISFNEETDVTIETWFQTTGSSQDMTILSNGRSDGTVGQDDAWNIFVQADGKVVIQSLNQEIESSMAYDDGQWHHAAVVVERTRAISLYIDGELVSTGNATSFGDFSGSRIWLGARGYFDGISGTPIIDRYFQGNLDDIRIWNTARKSLQIKRDRVSQLNGDELGLIAYYSFDALNVTSIATTRIPSLEDVSENSFDLTVGGGTGLNYDNNTPPIKLPRRTKRVLFDYTVNNDQIFIDITEEARIVENVTLDITVQQIKDKAGNFMESPETWIAYIDKNQVFWETEYFQFEKKLEDNLSFKAKIKNTGGSQENYSLGNLPTWLSASPSSGLIDPNSTIEVIFTVQPLLNIGEYEQDVYVTTESFGFNERLLLDLKVIVDPPDWVVDEEAFPNSMNITGQLLINDVISTDPEDMVSVWVNDSLRGVSHVEFDPSSGKNLVFLTIVSDSASMDNLSFKAWDASRGRLLVDLEPLDFVYTNNQILGSRTSPIPIKATVLTELTYVMKAGWNWISFPLAAQVLSDVNNTLNELSPTDNDEVNFLSMFQQYSGSAWGGNLPGFDTEKGYKIKLAKADTFRYEGSFIDPSLPSEIINISEGWNWIGLKSEFIIDVPSAMASLDPQTGDLIKGQRSFAIYEDGFGWGGNLDFLQPQVGYMLKYHTSDELIYPGNLNARGRPETQLKSRSQRSKEYAQLEKSLNYVSGKYSNTMSLIAEIDACIALNAGVGELDLSQWSLVAHAGDECRGVVESTWLASTGKYVYYLSIEGNSNVNLSFQLVHNTNGSEISLSQKIQYISNSVAGMNSAPYQFTCIPTDDCMESSLFQSGDIDMSESEMNRSVMMDLRSNAMLPKDRIYRFRAGNTIELMLGFEVMDGATLEAYIEDCITTKQ